jgi:hypothetical protein
LTSLNHSSKAQYINSPASHPAQGSLLFKTVTVCERKVDLEVQEERISLAKLAYQVHMFQSGAVIAILGRSKHQAARLP